MKKIELLKTILDSQVKRPKDWPSVIPVIEKSNTGLNLVAPDQEVGFAFDKTGEKFLGIFNWKD